MCIRDRVRPALERSPEQQRRIDVAREADEQRVASGR